MARKVSKKSSYKERVAKMQAIVLTYQKANLYLNMLERKVYVLNEKTDEDKIQEYKNCRLLFETFFNTLEEDEKLIIMNDFYERLNVNWWIGTYSRSTYYRIKNRAIDRMLFYYE